MAASRDRQVASTTSFVSGDTTRDAVEAAVRTLIDWSGDDSTRPELLATPTRVATAFGELFAGYAIDPVALLRRSLMANDAGRQVVSLRGLRFVSFCEHHLLPFIGRADIAYVADQHLVGIGTIAQALDALARRLQVQERLTDQLATAIGETALPFGTAVRLKAEHLCMSARGSKACGEIITTRFVGEFATNDALRADFLMLSCEAWACLPDRVNGPGCWRD